MKFFSKTTRGHHVLTGRKNYESIPKKYRPLPGRTNIVVTRSEDYQADGALVVSSIKEGIEHARSAGETNLFIIGGGEIYKQTLELADTLVLTHVQTTLEGDTFFPEFSPTEWVAKCVLRHPKDDVHNFGFEVMEYSKK